MKIRKDAIAPKPPMGWNSWDCYMSAVTEAQLMENAEYMKAHLLPCGWDTVVCDIQWYEPTAGAKPGMEYIPFARLNMDEYGNTSSASIPIALNEMAEKGIIKKGSVGVLTGFGAGLTWGSMLIKF